MLFAATGDGVVRLEGRGPEWSATATAARGGAQCLAWDGTRGVLYAGRRGAGLERTADGGRTWDDCALPQPDVYAVAVSAADGALYAGTEPSRLFRSDDAGASWTALDALLELPSRPTWSFPPRPWTSHVRWIAPSPHEPAVLLAGIELGGLMRSADRGETWEDHRPGAQRDVHSLAWHPREPGRAYEAGGGGTAWSDDWGDTWTPADDGRDRHYSWSTVPHPTEPDTWYVSASTGPFAAHGRGDPQARIYRRSGAGPWQPLAGGLPDPLPAMPYALLVSDGQLIAGLANGELWASVDGGDTWRQARVDGDRPTAIVALVAAG